MTIKERLEQDLKAALLDGDKELAMTLRGLKAAILNIEVAEGLRDSGLPDDKVIALFQKEAKKRQESADLYEQGKNLEKQAAELAEKKIIERYLPAQLSEAEIEVVVNEVFAESGVTGMQHMGQVIGGVKARVGAQADGAIIARLVKEKLQG